MKNRKLSIRISEADLQTIHQQAEEANMTLTKYVTACCLGKEIVVIHGLDEVIRQQKGIGRNLNQLTALANMGKVKSYQSCYYKVMFKSRHILRDRDVPIC